jgi:serine protease Do
LRDGQEIERGYLGVNLQPMNDDLAASLGLERNRGEIVQVVSEDSPAERAGLKAGDIIISVSGRRVSSDQTVSFLVANIAPGESVPVEVLREGRRLTINTTLGKRPTEAELAQQAQSFDPDAEEPMDPDQVDDLIAEKLGLQVMEMNAQIARSLGVPADTQGLVIGAVDPNSDSAAKGLRRGDIVLSANYQTVTTIASLRDQISAAQEEGRDAVLLRIQRRGAPPRFVPIRLR